MCEWRGERKAGCGIDKSTKAICGDCFGCFGSSENPNVRLYVTLAEIVQKS